MTKLLKIGYAMGPAMVLDTPEWDEMDETATPIMVGARSKSQKQFAVKPSAGLMGTRDPGFDNAPSQCERKFANGKDSHP